MREAYGLQLKTCSDCKEKKYLHEFNHKPGKRCKKCQNALNRSRQPMTQIRKKDIRQWNKPTHEELSEWL